MYSCHGKNKGTCWDVSENIVILGMSRNQDLPRLRRVKLNSRRCYYLSVTPILALGSVSPHSQLGFVVHSSIASIVTEDGLRHLLSRINLGENHNEKKYLQETNTTPLVSKLSPPKNEKHQAREKFPLKILLDLTAGSSSAHSR